MDSTDAFHPRPYRPADDHASLAAALDAPATPHREALGKLLMLNGKLTQEQLTDALAAQMLDRSRHLGELLVGSHNISVDDLYLLLSYQLSLPLVRLGNFEVDPDVVQLLPQEFVRRHTVMPLMLHRDRLVVAMENPADAETLNHLSFATTRTIEPVLATPDDIELAIATYYAPFDDKNLVAEIEQLSILPPGADLDPRRAEKLAQERPTVRLVNNIILDAIRRRASDIHVRPQENSVELLFRIDGSMIHIRTFSRSLLPAIVSRIKIISGMDISEHRLPQDGRSRVSRRRRTVDLRVSVIPAVNGESVVIRILDTSASLRSLDDIGFTSHDAERFRLLLERSHGMLLVTGPTGSGKSTTLYAALQQVRHKPVNIITVEDPVEYHLDGVRQIQINTAPGYTFARALRHILRHDPDVIMIGEIRDGETASIAVESALTGHLVLSTLHTNSAATSITRLLEIGIEPYLLNSTLLGVLAQRLVKRNCAHCRVEEQVDHAVRRELGVSSGARFWRGAGCEHCNNTGFHGRAAVYELLEVTPGIAELIRPGVLATDIEALAIQQGMTRLTQNALSLARDGITPLAEAFRVRLE